MIIPPAKSILFQPQYYSDNLNKIPKFLHEKHPTKNNTLHEIDETYRLSVIR